MEDPLAGDCLRELVKDDRAKKNAIIDEWKKEEGNNVDECIAKLEQQ